jgi:CTP:molybdopterin cytidylyltransferase MocA
MRTVGLVLAAGASRRFGSPKQLATVSGTALVNLPIRALRAGGLTRVFVVLGSSADQVADVLEDGEPVICTDWSAGMSASLRCGIAAAAAAGADRVVVALGDQPDLSPAAVSRVLAQRAPADIVRASYRGVPGHPTVLSAATFDAVAELRGDAGARMLRGFRTVTVACDGAGSDEDIDRPEQA